MKTSLPLLLLAVASSTAAGCGAPASPGEPVGSAEQAVGPSTLNGLDPKGFWRFDTLQAIQTLGNAPLSQFPSLPTMPDAWRATVLSHVIECALPATYEVYDGYSSPNYMPRYYVGSIGLAPNWMNAPLDADGRRWVTGCVIQRLNYFAQQVPILLKGNNPAIYDDPNLDLQYTMQESTAWGDLFSSPPTRVMVNVCYEADIAQDCTWTGIDWLEWRICDNMPAYYDGSQLIGVCGLHIVGPCSTACTTSTTGYPMCQVTTTSPWDDHTVHVQLEPSCTP